jgi:hypothetical protein
MDSRRIEDDILVEARRAIEIQVAQLDELRARTGLLFAAASLSGSFLGSAASSGRISLGFWGSAAVVAFVCAIGACIKVLWPRKEAWTFVTSQKHLIREWVKTKRPDESMHLFLAECLEDHFDANKERLDGLYLWFQAAAVSVGAVVILGTIQLATSH